MIADYLADKSALARARNYDQVADQLHSLASLRRLWTCGFTTLEIGYSARNFTEWKAIQGGQQLVHSATVTEDVVSRAIEVQGLLARSSQHRVPIVDLLIAACAESCDLVVLHYDSDFDRIAKVTGQPTQWIAPKGSLN